MQRPEHINAVSYIICYARKRLVSFYPTLFVMLENVLLNVICSHGGKDKFYLTKLTLGNYNCTLMICTLLRPRCIRLVARVKKYRSKVKFRVPGPKRNLRWKSSGFPLASG